MCEFCMQHGDGKTWYLQTQNYAIDLTRDIERREYVVDFVTGFDRKMKRNLPLLKAVRGAPRAHTPRLRRVRPPATDEDTLGPAGID
ncbi:MAG TPA: hypothetical protein DCP20_09310 [Coriobacteriia bacterium]|nr:MAG: 4Fe-4S ferredoxin iron-sulfur binding domain-containing protein [Actinobacteria bacterium 66_15]HAL30893.1 hypothetical protein [Coriobacteriia bacterium]